MHPSRRQTSSSCSGGLSGRSAKTQQQAVASINCEFFHEHHDFFFSISTSVCDSGGAETS
jgi:hypothetical protein